VGDAVVLLRSFTEAGSKRHINVAAHVVIKTGHAVRPQLAGKFKLNMIE
jgi:hypothetical protein